LTLLLLVCFWTAVGMPNRCGIEDEATFAVFIVALTLPATFGIALIAAVSGYFYPRWTFIVQAALIVICIAVIGIFQAVPHYDNPPGATNCRFDM
jgi:hypothetical protein